MSIDLVQHWADIDPHVPFHSVIHASYPVTWKQWIPCGPERELCSLTVFLLALTAESFMHFSVFTEGEAAGVDGD